MLAPLLVKRVLTALLAIGSSLAFRAVAQVDPNIHKLCVEAKDYAGCVRAMKGDTTPTGGRMINSQGADIAEGNQCTAGYAYIGGGNCQDVKCSYNSSGFNALGHDSLIAGKKDSSGNDVWGCKYNIWHGAGVLRLSGAVTRTSNNPSCPPGEPQLGFNSTCQTAPRDWEAKKAEEKTESKCDLKLRAYSCSYTKYLEANPNIKNWAESNPGMAQKERIRLQSVD